MDLPDKIVFGLSDAISITNAVITKSIELNKRFDELMEQGFDYKGLENPEFNKELFSVISKLEVLMEITAGPFERFIK
jgi:hypothetical protein